MREFLRSAALLLLEITRALVGYVRGQFLLALILSLMYLAGYGILRIPAWPLAGLVCGFSHLIPMFGPVLALAFTVAVALFGGAGLYKALGVFGVFIVVQAFEGFYLTPRILGSSVHLPPFAVFAALLFASLFFGFIGVLLAVPVLAILAVTWRFFHRRDG